MTNNALRSLEPIFLPPSSSKCPHVDGKNCDRTPNEAESSPELFLSRTAKSGKRAVTRFCSRMFWCRIPRPLFAMIQYVEIEQRFVVAISFRREPTSTEFRLSLVNIDRLFVTQKCMANAMCFNRQRAVCMFSAISMQQF